MNKEYIELRQNRDFGEIITVYFDFFKQNLKSFTNTFISYNGIFILLLLGCSYLLVTGLIGAFHSENLGNTEDFESNVMIGLGAILFFLVFMGLAVLNYSLSSSYMIIYERKKKIIENKKEVLKPISGNLGNIIIFIVLLVLIYIGFFIVSIILAFIPIIGTLVQYVIQFGVTSWLGVSFMVLLTERKSPTESLGEGWDLVTTNFWKCVGVNFILGILLAILMFLVIMIPGVIVGVYTYHVVESGTIIAESVFAKVIYTLGTCILLVIMVYSQSLSQFVNGLLYFSLHEKKYNINTRAKIEQIGAGE